jgi:hypothetical protein
MDASLTAGFALDGIALFFSLIELIYISYSCLQKGGQKRTNFATLFASILIAVALSVGTVQDTFYIDKITAEQWATLQIVYVVLMIISSFIQLSVTLLRCKAIQGIRGGKSSKKIRWTILIGVIASFTAMSVVAIFYAAGRLNHYYQMVILLTYL